MNKLKFTYTFLALTLMLGFSSCGYNQLVEFDERADKYWYQIEDAYNRQNDLVPLLIKQYPNANTSYVKSIENARKEIADLSIEKDEIAIGKIKKYVKLQQQLTKPVDRLLNDIYNDIKNLPKGNQERESLKTLASQIMGSHNRIGLACDRYNDVVDEYNEYQSGFMQRFTSSSAGFHHKEKLDIDLFERNFPDFEALDRSNNN